MHQCRASRRLHLALHSTEVVEDWTSVLWNTMVWPGGQVELCHLQLAPSNLVTLHGDECMAGTGMKCLSSKLYCLHKQANTRYGITSFQGSPHAQKESQVSRQCSATERQQLTTVRLLWLSGRALAAQARGVLGLTPGDCRPFLYFHLITSKFLY